MTGETVYPRVLVVAIGRVNAKDNDNNGMLLRSLFSGWPCEKLAQIYSSDDKGDAGFFGHYYKLGPQDRRMGSLFYWLKAETQGQAATVIHPLDNAASQTVVPSSRARRLLVDTGLYELIFSPRVSPQMRTWVESFEPDIIFAQGYNLTFARLPVLLKNEKNAKLAFFCSDDWPTYLYAGLLGEPKLLRCLIRPIVRKAVARLLDATDVPLAFGQPMADQYTARYGKVFTVLSHADDQGRFESAQPVRAHSTGIYTLMAIGNFNQFRWPLLLDVNESCRILNDQGIQVRVAVLSSAIEPEGARQLAQAPYIDIFEDPGNDRLPCYLKGADLFLLVEGFDEGFVSAIRLSISSKAHLFMFSQHPVIVYAHPDTGVAQYASTYHWARVVSRRDIQALTQAIRDLLTDNNAANVLVRQATATARAYHSCHMNKKRLFDAISSNVFSRR